MSRSRTKSACLQPPRRRHFCIEPRWCWNFTMDIEASPTYQALPEHAKSAWLKAVRALPPAWLLPPATGELFEGRDHCLKRLNGYGLYEGFVVVSGRVWKETALRWQFLCKMHGRVTANAPHLAAYRQPLPGRFVSPSVAPTAPSGPAFLASPGGPPVLPRPGRTSTISLHRAIERAWAPMTTS
jgi:hypothetical protein